MKTKNFYIDKKNELFDFLGTVGVNYITEMKNSRFMIHYIFFTDKGTFSIFWYEFENSSLPHIDKKLGYDKCDCWEVYEKGSGSTGVAAIKNDRNFVGIEINKEYFDIAEKRIKEAKNE